MIDTESMESEDLSTEEKAITLAKASDETDKELSDKALAFVPSTSLDRKIARRILPPGIIEVDRNDSAARCAKSHGEKACSVSTQESKEHQRSATQP